MYVFSFAIPFFKFLLFTIFRLQNHIYLVLNDVSVPGEPVNLNMIIFPDLLVTIHSKPVHSIFAVWYWLFLGLFAYALSLQVPQKLDFCEDSCIPSIEFVVYVILSSAISFYTAFLEQVR